MTQTIINLTIPVIQRKVEAALEDVPSKSVPMTETTHRLQEKLVAYVVSRMPTYYVTAERHRLCALDNPISCFSQAQQAEMDHLIYEGLQHLIARRSSWEVKAQTATGGFESSPSHWFG
ncbi:hypothetical protein [Leptolyngbya iicbica]|uniref:Late competence development ComFB family protein n=2 Tax=Cyanophyceae TaxID=3028117 RepID=A0A4V2E260_9CYAN|nr:hypothetical protein [Leptolyngbya sp. LK]RZM77122.1 hypothetical protein DYY88_15835 [Leptolyngbya sp. LK]